MRSAAIISAAVLLATASPSFTRTIVVDQGGGGDYATIQDGIDAATHSDTVLVVGGTYTGERNRDLDFGGIALRLQGSPGHDLTTIDCEGAGRGFYFHGGEDTTAVVEGMMIANASADTGAGAYCRNGSSPKFELCIFTDNHASVAGGGLCALDSAPVIRDCYFDSNTASDASRPSGRGGGLACLDGSAVSASGTVFVGNVARLNGGALCSMESRVTCVRCEFNDSQLTSFGNHGAGAYVHQSSNSSFTGCTFEENGGLELVVGAGLVVSSSSVAVTDCIFLNNTAGGAGGARVAYASSSCVFDGCTFAGNVGTWSAAGAIQVIFDAGVLITKCTFVDNGYSHIWCQEASPEVLECVLSFSRSGPPVRCQEGTETPLITHCFIFGNEGGDDLCGGNHHDNEYADPAFCDVWGYDLTLCEDSPCLPGACPWGVLVGAHGQGCPPCGTSVEAMTWGAIKAMYR